MAAADSTPQAVVSASVCQLKALATSYYHVQKSARCSLLWHTSLLYVGNAILHDPGCFEWEYYFDLCVDAYLRLSENFQIAMGFLQGLLWTAINNERLLVSEVRRILKQLAETQQHTPEDFKSGHLIHVSPASSGLPAISIEAVIDRLHDITVADEVSVG